MSKQTPTAVLSAFGRGVPTKPEVDRLMELIGSNTEGHIISHKEIEACITDGRRTHRGLAIITAWKKRALRELNVLLVSVAGTGYEIADGAGRMTWGAGMVKQGVRRIRKAGEVAESTDADKLDDVGRKLRDHLRTVPARLRLAELTAPKS